VPRRDELIGKIEKAEALLSRLDNEQNQARAQLAGHVDFRDPSLTLQRLKRFFQLYT
jgi:hypothetical protein